MFEKRKSMAALMVTLLLGLGAGGVSVGAALDTLSGDVDPRTVQAGDEAQRQEVDFSSGPVQCQILADVENGMMVVQSIVHVLEAVDGTYALRITGTNGANRSSIQQGGYFSADASAPQVLGRLMLGADRTYDISLRLHAQQRDVECAQRIQPSA